ncbi:MAG TPA: NAD(+) synthase, partial [Clostridiales bacterium]|nr:NAD(+) synthase [Clostridiales bacterium]
STLALLVTAGAFHILGLPEKNIIGITMPGLGTTKRTHQNAVTLMQELCITTREISIVEACMQHFRDIGHDASVHDVTFENTQARERTQILMDVANQEGGLVIGTGDLSELALGWCTYNGDHMSNYAVNAGVPKSLVRHLVSWYSETTKNERVAEALRDILETPISPELLPADKDGHIAQKTEETIGPYDLHDFFLYHMVRHGFSPAKILKLATLAFPSYP